MVPAPGAAPAHRAIEKPDERVSGIIDVHVNFRYRRTVLRVLAAASHVFDCGCGVGDGLAIVRKAG